MEVYFSLGSNLGCRLANIEKAITRLSVALEAGPERLSSIMETPSDGFDGPAFLNCAALYILPDEMSPDDILDRCQKVEQKLGRPAHEAEFDAQGKRVYSSRTIDIDILLIGDKRIETPRLSVPHPGAFIRSYMFEPLKEICPDWDKWLK